MSNTAATKKWTIMVYLAGDNNLDANGMTDLKEMKKIGSTSGINVIAQFDRAGAGLSTKRFFLRKGTSLDADEVAGLGEINTGEPEFLLDFIKWGTEKYKAEHYMLILWNHGQGWDDTDIFAGERIRGTRLPRINRIRHAFFRTSVVKMAKMAAGNNAISRAILIDDDAKDFLDSLEMKKVLNSAKAFLGRKIDILGMDACLMSMAEVGCQIQKSVRYTVGSEETEPLDGWPYDTILGYMAENPGVTPKSLCKIIVKKYIEFYKSTGDAVTQSACDLVAAPELVAAVAILTRTLTTALSDPNMQTMILRARSRSQEYQISDNIDLVHFCSLLKASAVPSAIAGACEGVINAIQKKQGMVFSSGYSGTAMKRSYGLAVYFPVRSVSPLYARLDFAKKTGWGSFLKAYISVIRK